MTTEILSITEIASGDSQKETLHNRALRQLEAQLIHVKDKDLATPPGSPAEGDTYIIAASPTGAWAGQAGNIAHYYGGSWKFYTRREGHCLWVDDEDVLYAYNGSTWNAITGAAGILPAADTTAIIKGSADATKQVRFEVDGLTTGTTRVLTVQDADGTVAYLSDISAVAVLFAEAVDDRIASLLQAGSNITLTYNDAGNALTIAAGSPGDTLPVADTTGIAKGSSDATKIVRLEVDGLTTGTTRVLTVQDKDGTLPLSGKPRVSSVSYASSVTLDCSTADVFQITLTGNITIAFSNGTDGQKIEVQLTQDATGSRTVTWDSAVKFGTDVASAVATTTASKRDHFGLIYRSSASAYDMVAVARGY